MGSTRELKPQQPGRGTIRILCSEIQPCFCLCQIRREKCTTQRYLSESSSLPVTQLRFQYQWFDFKPGVTFTFPLCSLRWLFMWFTCALCTVSKPAHQDCLCIPASLLFDWFVLCCCIFLPAWICFPLSDQRLDFALLTGFFFFASPTPRGKVPPGPTENHLCWRFAQSEKNKL